MVILNTIQAFKEKGVFQIALKSGLISPATIFKYQIYCYYIESKEPLNKNKINDTCVYFDVDKRYVYDAIRFIKGN